MNFLEACGPPPTAQADLTLVKRGSSRQFLRRLSLLIIGRTAAAGLTTLFDEGCSRNRQTAPGSSE